MKWKTGQGEPVDGMDRLAFEDLYFLIKEWTTIEREDGLFRIGMMIGGDPDKKENSKDGFDKRGT